MKQITFAGPNSVSDVLYEIDDLRQRGKLTSLGCHLLEMFYVTGWDDGFVLFDRGDLCRALSATPLQFDRAVAELERRALVKFHETEAHEVAEIIALSTPLLTGLPELGWWQYYRLEELNLWFNTEEEQPD